MPDPSVESLTTDLPTDPLQAHERQGEILAALNRIEYAMEEAEEAKAKELQAVRDKYAKNEAKWRNEHEALMDALREVGSTVMRTADPPPAARTTTRRKTTSSGATADLALVLKGLKLAGKGTAKVVGEEVGLTDSDAVNKALAELRAQGKARVVEGSKGRYKQYEAVS